MDVFVYLGLTALAFVIYSFKGKPFRKRDKPTFHEVESDVANWFVIILVIAGVAGFIWEISK